jgi:hypothetical protein
LLAANRSWRKLIFTGFSHQYTKIHAKLSRDIAKFLSLIPKKRQVSFHVKEKKSCEWRLESARNGVSREAREVGNSWRFDKLRMTDRRKGGTATLTGFSQKFRKFGQNSVMVAREDNFFQKTF